MSTPPQQFSRISGRVNLPLLRSRMVVVVGVGTVGSQVARELANSGVGRLRLIDGDKLERHNLPRHALSAQYIRQNKATAMADYLAGSVPRLRVEVMPRYLDESWPDRTVDELLGDADLIVAATDHRMTQRHIGRRALSLDIPAIFPGLYADGGGEVFVQPSSRLPCFLCWDGFRGGGDQLRAVTALNAEGLAVLQLAVQLSLGILDPASGFARLLAGTPTDSRPRQVFVQRPFAALSLAPAQRRPNCPSCSVGPPRSSGTASPRTGSPGSSTPPRRPPPPRQQSQPTTAGRPQRGPTATAAPPRPPTPRAASSREGWPVIAYVGSAIAVGVIGLGIVYPAAIAAVFPYVLLAVICLLALVGIVIIYL